MQQASLNKICYEASFLDSQESQLLIISHYAVKRIFVKKNNFRAETLEDGDLIQEIVPIVQPRSQCVPFDIGRMSGNLWQYNHSYVDITSVPPNDNDKRF